VSASYSIRSSTRAGLWGLRALATNKRADVREVPALRDVSFTVPKGSVLGVIGRNGAGKSTLLRTVSGILAPKEGRIVVRGRISPLLSVGLWMHPDLSDRESVRLWFLAFGHSPDELGDLTKSIIDFAQLGEYVEFPFR